MATPDLSGVAEQVVRRAQRQGAVGTRDIREELTRSGCDPKRWKEVLTLAGASLIYRGGRYQYLNPTAARVRQEELHQQAIQRTVRGLIRYHRQAARKNERRGVDRLDFIQPVVVTTEDGRSYRLLSRDLSLTGIRLVGTRRLLGQKLQVRILGDGRSPAAQFVVRVLWTCAVGDDLFENGGNFLAAAESSD